MPTFKKLYGRFAVITQLHPKTWNELLGYWKRFKGRGNAHHFTKDYVMRWAMEMGTE